MALVAKAAIEPLREQLVQLFQSGRIDQAQLKQAGQVIKNSELVYLQQQVRRAKAANDKAYFGKKISRLEWMRLNHLEETRLNPCPLCGAGNGNCPFVNG